MTEEIKRKLYLFKDIDNESVEPIIKEIYKVNEYDNEGMKKVVDYKREPIEIYINTFGGSVYDGFGLIDVIRTSKTPIHTIVVGYAMSMGFLIAASGLKRFAHQNSTYMYHDISSRIGGKLEYINQEATELQRLIKIYDQQLRMFTLIEQEELDEVKKLRKEWYLSASEAKEYGLFDEYVN